MHIQFIAKYWARRKWAGPLVILLIILTVSSCRKLVNVPPPQNQVTTATAFSTDALAESAVAGIYYNLIKGTFEFGDNASTILGGLSADELLFFDETAQNQLQFQNNNILATNALTESALWGPCYFTIYQCNGVIEGLTQYPGVDDSTKTELLGEARFLRALAYFYATNFFGKVPLPLTTNWTLTRTYTNLPSQRIYQQIISDLLFAQQVLPADYSVGGGEKTRANKWAATALLARVYLYEDDWTDAFSQANAVIGNSQFALVDSLDQVFNANSPEAILQLQPKTNGFDWTPEGQLLIPVYTPYAYLTDSLLAAFEPGDNRRNVWVDSFSFNGTMYYYPFKYNIGTPNQQFTSIFPQYYMVLRLGEQYLIRAEAEANGAGNGVAAAINDLNAIRNRAGLNALPVNLSQQQVIQAVAHERRIELFCEWGHRWLDLKRTGTASDVLSGDKGFSVGVDALLYPIPSSELIADPDLVQNPGYQQ